MTFQTYFRFNYTKYVGEIIDSINNTCINNFPALQFEIEFTYYNLFKNQEMY